MYISKLTIENFRKYEKLEVNFNKGFNLLVGENDSGKSAIIDAIRKVLWTQSYEPDRLEEEDFYNRDTSKEIKITLEVKGLEDSKQAQHFLEWLGYKDGKPFLKIWFSGKCNEETKRCYGEVKAGPDEKGARIDAGAREYLMTTYLKPLRDAENELQARKYSRLSRILYTHKAFKYQQKDQEKEHSIYKIMEVANEQVSEYFRSGECGEVPDDQNRKKAGEEILSTLNEYLKEFSTLNELRSDIKVGKDLSLKDILETLELNLGEIKPGLGSLNRLFIAAEFLLLNKENYTGLKLGLIEEIEAHLHPQIQLRLVEYLQKISGDEGIQLIVTSHSSNLASKVNLENIILISNECAYPLSKDQTKLEKGDYRFLERFLDVTKSNMFFAKGIIIVEGDAENLLLPRLAQLLGRELSKSGVSIVNVGSRAFLRYSRIYQRSGDKETIGIPISIITDVDVDPTDSDLTPKQLADKIKEKKEELEKDYNAGDVIQTFVSPHWTLEYCLAKSILWETFYKAVLYAEKEKNSNKYCVTEEKKKDVDSKIEEFKKKMIENGIIRRDESNNEKYEILKGAELAKIIYKENLLKKRISKAITAQYFSELLEGPLEGMDPEDIEKDSSLGYLINAIKHVTKQEDK